LDEGEEVDFITQKENVSCRNDYHGRRNDSRFVLKIYENAEFSMCYMVFHKLRAFSRIVSRGKEG
jgi:hypothetical protein